MSNTKDRKSTISVNEANKFITFANKYLKGGETKFKYAILQVLKNLNEKGGLLDLHKKDVNKEKYKLAGTDPDGFLLTTINPTTGEESYKYTPENREKLDAALDKIADKQYPFEAWIAEDVPDLTDYEIAAFEGIIIPKHNKSVGAELEGKAAAKKAVSKTSRRK